VNRLLARLLNRQVLSLGAALTASGLLILVPGSGPKPPPAPPASLAVAWPRAQSASIPAILPDGTEYTPAVFLDARTSVGTAPTRDGKALRLLWRGADASVRQLRRLPRTDLPSFRNVTISGNVLAWLEDTHNGRLQLWTLDLRAGSSRGGSGSGSRAVGRPRAVTVDLGAIQFHGSQYDLTINGGRLYWVAADPQRYDVVQLRSVALTGGPVQLRVEPGTWALSSWPWLVNGATTSSGTTGMRNLLSGQSVAVHRSSRLQTTNCSPVWCHTVSLTSDGSTRVDLSHPDGGGRVRIAGDGVSPAITDVAPLSRFDVLAKTDPNVEISRNEELLVYEIATRRTVELSLNAVTVSYARGVLWWANGTENATQWHTLDLRTV
jgi:hypothetical protein